MSVRWWIERFRDRSKKYLYFYKVKKGKRCWHLFAHNTRDAKLKAFLFSVKGRDVKDMRKLANKFMREAKVERLGVKKV
jgi:hypothetical protein